MWLLRESTHLVAVGLAEVAPEQKRQLQCALVGRGLAVLSRARLTGIAWQRWEVEQTIVVSIQQFDFVLEHEIIC